MSSLTTTTVTTANGVTNLTLNTGNTSGPSVIVKGATDVVIKANTSADVFIANATSIKANTAVNIANTLTVTGQTTLNTVATGASFSGNTTFVNVAATYASLTSANVTSNTLALGTSSIATSGYTRLPNGLLMQWGTVTSNSISGSITFPTAFAASPYSVSLTGSSLSTATYAYVTATSTTGATIKSTSGANPASNVYFYIAIGV